MLLVVECGDNPGICRTEGEGMRKTECGMRMRAPSNTKTSTLTIPSNTLITLNTSSSLWGVEAEEEDKDKEELS
jgi:hypothetical protein